MRARYCTIVAKALCMYILYVSLVGIIHNLKEKISLKHKFEIYTTILCLCYLHYLCKNCQFSCAVFYMLLPLNILNSCKMALSELIMTCLPCLGSL
jgi:hypothetical protein